MPSVYATYQGRLTDEAAQDRLSARIRFIASGIDPFFSASTQDWNRTIEGPILANCDHKTKDGFAVLEHARVAGTVLRLVDFRGDEHLFPFVFVRQLRPLSSATRRLVGRLVRPVEADVCRRYRHARIREADFYLANYGGSMLRYELESEFDLLMAYVRTFFVPGLFYWRYSALPRIEGFEAWVSDMTTARPGQMSFEKAAVELTAHTKKLVLRELTDEVSVLDLPRPVLDQLQAEGTVEALAVAMVIAAFRQGSVGKI